MLVKATPIVKCIPKKDCTKNEFKLIMVWLQPLSVTNTCSLIEITKSSKY